jgi:hypothetical protein
MFEEEDDDDDDDDEEVEFENRIKMPEVEGHRG